MMKSSEAAAKLQAIGIANSLGIGKKKSSPKEDIKSAWRRGGLKAALPYILIAGAIYGVLGGAILAIILAVGLLLTFLRAYVLTHLWGWFIVPLGAPSLGLAHAIGISILFGFMIRIMLHDVADRDDLKLLEKRLLSAFGKEPEQDKKEWRFQVKRLFIHFLSPVAALGIGYIVHSYM